LQRQQASFTQQMQTMDDILRQTKASLKTSQEADREIEAQLRREHEQECRRQCEAADSLEGRLHQVCWLKQ
jgi:hypothetical protein